MSAEQAAPAATEAPAVNLERKARKEAQKALKAQQAAEKKLAKQAASSAAPQPAASSSCSSKPKPARRVQSGGEQLSRALAYILRHGADKEGLAIRADGYVVLADLLERPRVKSVNMAEADGGKRRPDIADVQRIVAENDKQRFELHRDDNDGAWLVRAVQGHSLGHVQLQHTPLTKHNLHLLALATEDQDDVDELAKHVDGKLDLGQEEEAVVVEVVHGTYAEAWTAILASGGLKPMSRNHIHLAKGRFGERGVVSGMRRSANRLVFIDVRRALDDGIPFQLSSNGVVLTPGNSQGMLPLKYVTRVEDAKRNTVWTPPI